MIIILKSFVKTVFYSSFFKTLPNFYNKNKITIKNIKVCVCLQSQQNNLASQLDILFVFL